jgi:hypothetical protein
MNILTALHRKETIPGFAVSHVQREKVFTMLKQNIYWQQYRYLKNKLLCNF